MKRGLAGKTRRGAPPLPQQRRALRVVQLTLLGLAAYFGWTVFTSWEGAATAELTAFAVAALVSLALSVAMGFRIVRGPQPPDL